MSLEWRGAQSNTLAWSNPVAWWWSVLTVVSIANIAVWFVLYRQLRETETLGNASGITLATPLRVSGAITFTNGLLKSPNTAAVDKALFEFERTIGCSPRWLYEFYGSISPCRPNRLRRGPQQPMHLRWKASCTRQTDRQGWTMP